MEELIPRGMIFWGPPGTGKTLFAKGMASSLGAAISIVSGPELKSKWVGESEENLRQVFHRARQSAPSIIVFDELDSFASARGTYTGSGVEHSMVNQLLTEMDGFHKEELVFVIGTTNFVEILDPALLRPGRFEFHLHIPYPDNDDRKAILDIYNKKMKLKMSEEALEYGVRRTGRGYVTPTGTPFSGDHINAMCRSLARIRLRDDRTDATTPQDIERAMTEWIDRPKMTPAEERVLATHEAGHAICSLFCPHTPPIERITIESENPWAFGYVRHQDPTHKYIQTQGFYLDAICVALAAREAELLLLNDLSLGAVGDLQTATAIARDMVEVHGMVGPGVTVARYRADHDEHIRRPDLSEVQRENLDRAIHDILEQGRQRAAQILKENRPLLETLRDLLLEKKTIDAKTLAEMGPPKAAVAKVSEGAGKKKKASA
jgi:cell division protease FtsH